MQSLGEKNMKHFRLYLVFPATFHVIFWSLKSPLGKYLPNLIERKVVNTHRYIQYCRLVVALLFVYYSTNPPPFHKVNANFHKFYTIFS